MPDGTAHDAAADVLNATAQGQLKSIIERIERLEQEKAEIAEQIKEVKSEAKGNGFVVKIINQVIRLRKMDVAKRQEEEAILDLYLSAIGEGPLFERREQETRVTIGIPGGKTIETTLGGMQRAAAAATRMRKA